MNPTLVYFGTVESTKDPAGLGRVQVSLLDFPGETRLPWLRLVQPQAGSLSGWVMLPEVGSEVVVLRGNGDHVESMVVLGALYNGKQKPLVADTDGTNSTKQIVTAGGSQIVFSDAAGKETIEISSGKGKVRVLLDAGQQTVTVESAKTIRLVSKGALEIKCGEANVDVKGPAKINAVTAELSGKIVTISAKATLRLDGKMLELSGKSIDIG